MTDTQVTITSLWPDGSLITAHSWRDLEEQVRARQWHKYSVGQFRREMRRRAQVWANKRISVQSAERMFRDLEDCGMVRLDIEGGEDSGRDSGQHTD